MQKIKWDKYEIEKLSKEDISSYFEMAYNNPIVKNMLNSSSSLSRATSNFQNFGNVLQAYVTATGDMSEEMVEKLAKDFVEYSDKIYQSSNNSKINGMQVFFADHVLPAIMQHHMQKQGMKEPLTLEQTAVILKSIELNCANNRFHTHSFNGALLNEIQTNGFDINKELFQEEYKILRSVGMYQPYQTGNLLFCELSKASFGYALYAPERLVYSLGGDTHSHKETHSINEHFTEKFQECLTAKNLSPEEYQKVYLAGKKILDFYFGENQSSVIAFKSVSNEIVKRESDTAHSGLQYALTDFRLRYKIDRICDNDNHPELKKRFADAIEEIKQSKKYEKMDSFIAEFQKLYPDNKVFQEIYRNAVITAVTKDCLNNFMYNGCADGYREDGGKLGTDKFSLAVIPNPVEQYVRNAKMMLAIEKENYMAREYNRELYEQKYSMDIKTGRQPIESFDEYCANNFSNTYFLTARKNGLITENPKYTMWKKKRGYDNPNSEASKTLENEIIARKNKRNVSPVVSINSFELV